MSGMSRAHSKQSSKFKNKFEGIRKSGLLDVHKKKRIAKNSRLIELKKKNPPKVKRGTARALKRLHLKTKD
jgi:hypothetical protein